MQGKSFGRSSDGGTLADTATRTWKILLNSPGESFDISSAIGVQIGDPLDGANPIPCVSIDVRADGESRLVRIVTANYRTTAGDGGSGDDPKTYSPDVRPANFSTSTSLHEMPATIWKKYLTSDWKPVRNPVGDPVDGIVRLEPITTIRVMQFQSAPGTVYQNYVGFINSDTMNLGQYATLEPHTVMFRGVEAQPHVETFGNTTYRGFMNSYEFVYRRNWVFGQGACGWDHAVILEGFNCVAFNPAAPRGDQEPKALPLKKDSEYKIKEPFALQDGVQADEKVRAMVWIAGLEEKAYQNPSSMPIALNEDGTPRKLSDANKPIIHRYQVQDEANLVNVLQLRLT